MNLIHLAIQGIPTYRIGCKSIYHNIAELLALEVIIEYPSHKNLFWYLSSTVFWVLFLKV